MKKKSARARAPAVRSSPHHPSLSAPLPPSDDTALRLRAIQVLDEARVYLINQGGGSGIASAAARAAAHEAAEAARLAGRGVAGAASGAYSSATHAVKDALHIGGMPAMPSAGDMATAAGRAAGVLGPGAAEPSAWRKAAAALHLPGSPQPGPSPLSTVTRKAASGLASMATGSPSDRSGGLLASMRGREGGLAGLMMGGGRPTKKGEQPSIYERVTGTGAAAPAPPSVLDKVKDALHFGGKAVSDAAGSAGQATAGAAGATKDAAAGAVDALSHALSAYATDASTAAADAATAVSGVSSDTATATARKLVEARDAMDKKWERVAAAYEKAGGAAAPSSAALARSWADAQRARAAAGAKLDESAHHLMMAAKKAGWEAPKAAVAEL